MVTTLKERQWRMAAYLACAVVLSQSVALDGQVPVSASRATGAVRDGSVTISVDDPRPLLRAVDELERLCACPVSYEGAPLESPDDLVDATVRPVGGRRALYAKGGPLEVSQPLGAGDVADSAQAILLGLIDAHRQRGYPGQYSVQRDDYMWHVVPSLVRHRAGANVPVESALAASVTLAERQGQALELIREFVASLRETSGVNVTLGQVPTNLFVRAKGTIRADGERADLVLGRFLGTIAPNLSWRLLYLPDSGTRILHIRAGSQRRP